jgi:L-fuconolactonase
MRIDAHQHYWKTSRTDYGWLKPELGRIYADYMPEHLKPLLKQFALQKTIVVQAAPTMEEAEFMLDLAEHDETIAGVVGWLDLESDAFEQDWNRFCQHPKFVGMRPMIQDLASDWILRDKVVRNLELLAKAQFPVDLQANPRHLPYIIELLNKVPDLWAVVDHLAKPPITEGVMEPWKSQMEQIASYPNVMCKFSGMVPEKLDAPWTKESVEPFARIVIDAFGKDRVMFGSDWPVCLFAATYAQVIDLLEFCIGPEWTDEERAALYGGNASRFYHLEQAPRINI